MELIQGTAVAAMAEWKGAFGGAGAGGDPVYAEVERIVSETSLPEEVLARLAAITQTPATLNSYRFSIYFALAMGGAAVAEKVRVLDIGAFVGLYVGCLRKKGFGADGIEIDPNYVEIAGTTGVQLIKGDAFHLGEYFKDGNYDLITCVNIMDGKGRFPSEEEMVVLCAACRRAMKTGGYLLINPPSEDPFPRKKVLELGFARCEREEKYCVLELGFMRHLVLKKT
jgi:hypothetical protein